MLEDTIINIDSVSGLDSRINSKKDDMDIYKAITEEKLARISPLTLAYLGDTVYESFIREYIIRQNIYTKINDLHKRAIKYVNATSQSKVINTLKHELKEDELLVFKRGRNHKKNTSAKNAKIVDYKHATGFEALIGYLYLAGDENRLKYIVKRSIEIIENK